jgi:hypothetical protein
MNLHLPQHRRLGNRLMFGMPLARHLAETQAQGIVLLDHCEQRLLQAMRFQSTTSVAATTPGSSVDAVEFQCRRTSAGSASGATHQLSNLARL